MEKPILVADETVRQSVIELSKICKTFNTDEMVTHALSQVDLTIEDGEFVSISGPSGCGKSTLLSIIGLLEEPTSGTYKLGAYSVAKLSVGEKAKIRNRKIGFIFQSFNLLSDLSVLGNVMLPLSYRGMSPKHRKQLAMEALERVDMVNRKNHRPSQLSGGQQQRVAVARAIAGKPQVLLADEPTGNLDSKNGFAVMDLLKSLHEEGSTVCMVTHDSRFDTYASREVHLFDGKRVNGISD